MLCSVTMGIFAFICPQSCSRAALAPFPASKLYQNLCFTLSIIDVQAPKSGIVMNHRSNHLSGMNQLMRIGGQENKGSVVHIGQVKVCFFAALAATHQGPVKLQAAQPIGTHNFQSIAAWMMANSILKSMSPTGSPGLAPFCVRTWCPPPIRKNVPWNMSASRVSVCLETPLVALSCSIWARISTQSSGRMPWCFIAITSIRSSCAWTLNERSSVN